MKMFVISKWCIYFLTIEYGNVSMIHFRHFVDVSKIGIYCNHKTRNVMISNKKTENRLCPNTSKSFKSRFVPRRFSLLIKALTWAFSFISDEIINVFVVLQGIANSSRQEFHSYTGYIQRYTQLWRVDTTD